MAIATLLALTATARAATITVDSLADPGAPGICALRDAITAANTMTATNGCDAGTGNDTIQFSVTGTISLGSTLPQVTDRLLTINGPASHGITIDGGGQVQVIQVASAATLNINKLTIANGSVLSNNGGGIFSDGTLTVSDSTFSGNSAFEGGGIFSDGTLTVTNSTFSGNIDGGIENFGTLAVTNSTFSDNVSFEGSGLENNVNGVATVSNSTFSDNTASDGYGKGYGAGISNRGTLAVTNSTFSDNTASDAAGIFSNGTLAVTNSTFSNNTGFAIYVSAGTLASFKSTILAGGGCEHGLGSGEITDAGYNISDDSSCGFSATGSLNNTDPMLDPAGLANNGGPTQTIALLSGSPAIDAIPLADCTDQASPSNPIITDQRLFPRPDGGENNCDIGAYEVQDTAFIPFSRFHGALKIEQHAGFFSLSGGFKLGSESSIDPLTQPVSFGVGNYAIRLLVGSFFKVSNGFVYQKKVNGVFLCLYIKLTDTPGSYALLAIERGATPALSTSPVPVTLTVGANGGSTQMNAKFD